MPGTRRVPQDERSAITCAKLVDSAYRILLQRGHAGFRLADITRDAGVSRGGLLHHYPTKEHLIAAVYENILQAMEDQTRSLLRGLRDDEILAGLIEAAQTRFSDESYRVLLDILSSSEAGGPVRTAQADYYRPSHQTALDDWTDRLAKTGISHADASVVVQFLWGIGKGSAIRSMVRSDDEYNRRVNASALAMAERHCDNMRTRPVDRYSQS